MATTYMSNPRERQVDNIPYVLYVTQMEEIAHWKIHKDIFKNVNNIDDLMAISLIFKIFIIVSVKYLFRLALFLEKDLLV